MATTASMATMQGRTGNLLLDALDIEQREGLLESARVRPVAIGDVLAEPGDEVESVFFPTSGTSSIIVLLEAAPQVEGSTIGREGIVEAFAALGSRRHGHHRIVCQIEGTFIQVPVEHFIEQTASPGRLQRLVHGYLQALFSQATLCVACNAVHNVSQRCARWLLQTHDRVDGDKFNLTQEYLAAMLGTARPTVSMAASGLQEAGFIRYTRGSIAILDREGLESAACECYEDIRSEYSRLVPLVET
jgi:CRP-like cAMP-binding protein